MSTSSRSPLRCFLTAVALACSLLQGVYVGALGVNETPVEEQQCACASSNINYQLLRGDDEVQKCQEGLYCDCKSERVQQCEPMMGDARFFNEAEQMCYFTDICKQVFESETIMPSPTTTEVVDSESPCACTSTTALPQLIRGEDEVLKCQKGLYCNCATSHIVRCDPLNLGLDLVWDELNQSCVEDIKCEDVLGIATSNSVMQETTSQETSPNPGTVPKSTSSSHSSRLEKTTLITTQSPGSMEVSTSMEASSTSEGSTKVNSTANEPAPSNWEWSPSPPVLYATLSALAALLLVSVIYLVHHYVKAHRVHPSSRCFCSVQRPAWPREKSTSVHSSTTTDSSA